MSEAAMIPFTELHVSAPTRVQVTAIQGNRRSDGSATRMHTCIDHLSEV